MILDKLVEKKNLFIYIDQRKSRLWVAAQELDKMLRDPEISSTKKKALMRGQMKLRGRHRELKYLRGILAGGRLKIEAKKMWLQNFEDGLIGDNRRIDLSKRLQTCT